MYRANDTPLLPSKLNALMQLCSKSTAKIAANYGMNEMACMGKCIQADFSEFEA